MAAGVSAGVGLLISRHSQAQSGTLNLYSARHYNTDEALYGNFADLTGIKINRVDAEPDPLVQRLRTEGDKSPCDVFITVDAGRIERAREMGLLQAVNSPVLAKAIPAHLRDPDNTWFGFSKRARVILYNKEKVTAANAPKNYEDRRRRRRGPRASRPISPVRRAAATPTRSRALPRAKPNSRCPTPITT